MSKIPTLSRYIRWLRMSVDDATEEMTPAQEIEYLRRRLIAEVVKCSRITWREPRTESVPEEGRTP